MLNLKAPGLYFNTKNGNNYFYDDTDGSVKLKEYLSNEDPIIPYGTNCSNYHDNPVNEDKIKEQLINQGYQQLILIITERCNLRCKYCAYSGQYESFRTHTETDMSPQIAKKAVNKYLEGFAQKKNKNPFSFPKIGFYGGEPLLNFDLIVNVVKYTKKLYPNKITFSLSTNGTILSDRMIDFLKSNDFVLSFSLNGSKKEHDRMRIFTSGEGTFEIVWNNLQRIHMKYPDFYRTKCNILITYDVGTDIENLTKFFEEFESELPLPARCNAVSQGFTDWYSNYNVDDFTNYQNQVNRIKEHYFETLQNGKEVSHVLEIFVGANYKRLMSRPQGLYFPKEPIPFTAACIPGQKIAVDPNGDFHCCEKINNYYPIGNIYQGLNIHKISNLLEDYKNRILPDCAKCAISRLCPYCYAVFAGPKGFAKSPTDLCQIESVRIKQGFEELWTMFENGVDESVILKTRNQLCTDV